MNDKYKPLDFSYGRLPFDKRLDDLKNEAIAKGLAGPKVLFELLNQTELPEKGAEFYPSDL